MKYGYVRVSTEAQNIARQMEEMYKLGLTDEFIYFDKQSCKDFERENYKLLKEILKKDDLLIIKSIDRLGRNYDMIINEWSEITKVIEVDILVIDFPLLDTREDGMNLVGNFISDIVLEVLSFVAQNEREIRKYFHADAYVNWHCSNEHFTVDEYIIANCEYPGEWDGIVERVEIVNDLIITVVRIYPKDKSASFHVTSFIQTENDKITAMDEYYADDGIAPQWRLDKHIGTAIK